MTSKLVKVQILPSYNFANFFSADTEIQDNELIASKYVNLVLKKKEKLIFYYWSSFQSNILYLHIQRHICFSKEHKKLLYMHNLGKSITSLTKKGNKNSTPKALH